MRPFASSNSACERRVTPPSAATLPVSPETDSATKIHAHGRLETTCRVHQHVISSNVSGRGTLGKALSGTDREVRLRRRCDEAAPAGTSRGHAWGSRLRPHIAWSQASAEMEPPFQSMRQVFGL